MPGVGRMLDRSRRRFEADPTSTRNAVRVVVAVVVLAVVVGSLVIWIFDRRDFPDFGSALWFSLQTVTTVGYGDLTPTTLVGRTVAGFVMVFGIAFVTVFTAAITSLFVESARRQRDMDARAADEAAAAHLLARLEEVADRLERIERHLGVESGPRTDDPST